MGGWEDGRMGGWGGRVPNLPGTIPSYPIQGTARLVQVPNPPRTGVDRRYPDAPRWLQHHSRNTIHGCHRSLQHLPIIRFRLDIS